MCNFIKTMSFFYINREKDFLQERESLLQQQAEKDQQYNSLVKSLKDRVSFLKAEILRYGKTIMTTCLVV